MSSSDLFRRNDATIVNGNILNGVTVAENITDRGSDIYFAICAVMGLTSLTTIGLSYMKPRTDRIFFYITAALNFTAFIAYFTMGSNLGWAPIDVEFPRTRPVVAGTNRAVFYVRYIDWVVTTPLLLMDLLLTAGLPWPTIIWTIFWDEVMIITGLVGALVSTRYKFGFYTIGCVAMFYIFYQLAYVGRRHANILGKDVGRAYFSCGVITLFMWTLYPVAWGLCEGGNYIASDSEAIFYGVLDLIAKPVFSAALIYGHWNINPARMGLSIRDLDANVDRSPNEKSNFDSNQGNDHAMEDHSSSATATSNNVSRNGMTHSGVPTNQDAHAGHRTGYTPAHEGATSEAPPHTV